MSYKSKYTGPQIDDILDSVAGKQNEIEDLASIRSGAAKGATALQSETYKGTITGVSANGTSVATSGVANIPAASTSTYGVTKLSSATNSTSTTLAATASAVKAAYDLANSYKGTVTGVKINGTTKNPSSGVVDLGTVITAHQDVSGKADKSSLAAVATSGSYNDLSNKPTIPSAVTESTVSGWGFTKNTGTYSKPSTGIPKTDLASAVQTSLGKADTAIQSTSFGKLIDLAVVKGFESAQRGTVYALPDEATGDEDDILLSSSSVKTINGTSIFGSGDIVISGGGGSSSGSGAYAEVNHGTSDTTFTLTPNTFHVWDEVSALTLTLGSETTGVANEYLFQFTSGATATSLTLPNDIKWANDSAPTIEPNMIYQVSILKGMASVLEFNNALNLIENHITYDEGDFMNGGTITFEYPTASEITFSMDYYGSSTLIVPQGSTQINIDWNEPSAPIIRSVSPTEDSIYKYIL